jgi:hypothetical protein
LMRFTQINSRMAIHQSPLVHYDEFNYPGFFIHYI